MLFLKEKCVSIVFFSKIKCASIAKMLIKIYHNNKSIERFPQKNKSIKR